jgi:chromosome segregation ATPase
MKSDPVPVNGEDKIEELQQSLDIIEHKLDTEILAKQKTIDRQEQEIQRLHLLIEGKDKMILEINEKLMECVNNSEGNRQLINKLVNEIDHLQQNIEWYKKTYETRSLFGMIREKLIKKTS